jgi:hypothetical protein
MDLTAEVKDYAQIAAAVATFFAVGVAGKLSGVNR